MGRQKTGSITAERNRTTGPINVSGDSYIDSAYMGTAVIGKLLAAEGWRVGIIAQPSLEGADDIGRLGPPRLFWGVTAGSMDSMVANYTALGKPRRSDDYTPGGVNDRRPDRSVIVYTNLIRRQFKSTAPIVLGGIEASLRRVAHYDFWSDRIRRSALFDAKADYLLYGMAEHSVCELARALHNKADPRNMRGLCYASPEAPEGYIQLPSYQDCASSPDAFTEMFHLFYRHMDPVTARGLAQLHDTRYLVQNPPAELLSTADMDRVYALGFERRQHPYYERQGAVRALDTVRFSIPTHRGCYGECHFCAIAVHEGRTIQWRSEESIVREAEEMVQDPLFRGNIQDVGGPTANMYGFECDKKLRSGCCEHKRCVAPGVCRTLKTNHSPYIRLLRRLRRVPGIKRLFVSSGIRYDMVMDDEQHGRTFVRELAQHHVSGQFKVAPEHCVESVLDLMGKPGNDGLLAFREAFMAESRAAGKKQFLTYYFIAAHPGCGEQEMRELQRFATRELQLRPEQVQIFTPTPSTYSSLMYWTKRNPFTGERVYVERGLAGKRRQKDILQSIQGGNRRRG